MAAFSNSDRKNSSFFLRLLVYISIFLLSIDFIYKLVFNITYQTRENCILYRTLPKAGFLFYEYFIELFLIIVVGIFAAVLLEKYFKRFGKFYPKNQFMAFIYASIVPVCSCGVVPLLSSMNRELPFRTVLTFVLAAPLLNPYIMVLSFSVLGLKYLIFRIIASYILAATTAYVVDLFMDDNSKANINSLKFESAKCLKIEKDVYHSTYIILKKILPYFIAAAALGISIEFVSPAKLINTLNLNDRYWSVLIIILVGIPVYFCNGADVVFLKPLILFAGLPSGTAMAFSLTSTSICITSIVMLSKFIGKKLTFVLIVNIILISYIIGLFINATSLEFIKL